MFIKHSLQGKTSTLIVYVDDFVLTGGDLEEMEQWKEYMASEFEIKDLGTVEIYS